LKREFHLGRFGRSEPFAHHCAWLYTAFAVRFAAPCFGFWLILMIGCAKVANLLLARHLKLNAARGRWMAVRALPTATRRGST
jgi:hypothetical protein